MQNSLRFHRLLPWFLAVHVWLLLMFRLITVPRDTSQYLIFQCSRNCVFLEENYLCTKGCYAIIQTELSFLQALFIAVEFLLAYCTENWGTIKRMLSACYSCSLCLYEDSGGGVNPAYITTSFLEFPLPLLLMLQ